MKEILFRGKETETGKWYYGGFFPHKKTTYCFKEDYEAHPENEEPCIVFDEMTDWGLPNRAKVATVIPETVSQYTGLQDKNGKQIFEGDILKITDDSGDTAFSDGGIGNVAWLFGMWYVDGEPQNSLYDLNNRYYMDVIGNIWDNPELLRVKNGPDD